jgi:hypothetical protein
MGNSSKYIRPKFRLYDIHNNPEHELWEEYIVEFVDISGIEIEYYISNYSEIDKDELYGEPLYQNISFSEPYSTYMVYEVTEEPQMITSFGLHSEDMIMFGYIPIKTFIRDVIVMDGVTPTSVVPKTGDVIRVLWNNRAYEVVTVKKENSVFQVSKNVYSFILKPYRFSEESEEARDISATPTLTLSASPSGVESFGDNDFIEDASDTIDDYGDVDTGIYGY